MMRTRDRGRPAQELSFLEGHVSQTKPRERASDERLHGSRQVAGPVGGSVSEKEGVSESEIIRKALGICVTSAEEGA